MKKPSATPHFCSTEEGLPPRHDRRAPSALIVDDEQVNLEILANILEHHDFQPHKARDGKTALRMLAEETFDLVLLDIMMPEIDGFQVLKQIRLRWTEAELPVIMVAGSSESDQIVEAFELGANDYLTKPIDVAVTMARITVQMRLKNAQTALRESEERYFLAARGTNDGLWDWNLQSGEVYYSPRWQEMLGLEVSEPPHTDEAWLTRVHPEDRSRVETQLGEHLAGKTPHFEAELRMEHTQEGFRWMLCRGLAVRNFDGTAYRIAGSLTDITEGKVADALTSLPNRVLLLERLQRCMARHQQHPQERCALLYLDLDNFKLVNDSLGHNAGDQLLVSLARRLEGCVRATDSVVSRLGGDEFAVLLERVDSERDAITIAQRILQSVVAPFTLGNGREIYTSASVGIGILSARCQEPVDLLQEADTAMYEAKAKGKSCYCVFDPAMKEQVTTRLEIEHELRHAIEQDQFLLHFQPLFHLGTDRLVGFEALIRWEHPQKGLIPPATFIPVAEETGLIVPVGDWVLHEACRQMVEWEKDHPLFKQLTMSVNLSVRQLSDPQFEQNLFSILNETGLSPKQLKLEITETTILKNEAKDRLLLSRLREHGISVVMDDFGTGFSSLTQLYRLALDALKIDQSFVNNIIHCIDNRTIVRTILNMAENLHLDVVAEGIENANQKRLLYSMGCRYGQGFYFSKPLPAEEVLNFPWDSLTELPVPSQPDHSPSDLKLIW